MERAPDAYQLKRFGRLQQAVQSLVTQAGRRIALFARDVYYPSARAGTKCYHVAPLREYLYSTRCARTGAARSTK